MPKPLRKRHARTGRINIRRGRPLHIEPLEARIVLDSTVVFNEIMYHPSTAPLVEGDYEWVELFNQNAVPMDLSNWSLGGGISYTFPVGTVIAGRGFLVVASNPTALGAETNYHAALGPFTGRMSNSGDQLILFDNSGRNMNEVDYSDSGDWPAGADGSGFSLAKIDPYSSSSVPASWAVSRQFDGTPGAQNFLASGQTATTTLVSQGTATRVLVPTDGSLGSSWTSLGFNDSIWTSGVLGVGFDTSGGGGSSELSDGTSSPTDGSSPDDDSGGGAATTTTWNGHAGDSLWKTASNWSNGLPVTSVEAFINGTNTVQINSTTTATAGRVVIGNTSSANAKLLVSGGSLNVTGDVQRIDVGGSGKGTLEISGGTVHVAANLNVGLNDNTATQGTVTIDGGALTVDGSIVMNTGNNLTNSPLQTLNMQSGSLTATHLYVGDGADANAVVNMTGGTMTVGDLGIPTNYGEPSLTGHFQLDGGTVTVTHSSTGGTQNQPAGFRLANGPPNAPLSPSAVENGTMDITAGTLILVGDARTLLQGYISAGVLTGYGSALNVTYDYNVTHPGYTTVTAHRPSVGGYVTTDISTLMHNVNSAAYIRTTFNAFGVNSVSALALRMQYNDGFVAYLNGQEVARSNAPANVSWNSVATASAGVVADQTFDISSFISLLHDGPNELAIEGLNTSAADSNFLVLPTLTATSVPDTPPQVVFNEVAAASSNGFWVELTNTGTSTVNLNGFSITTSAGAGSTYTFGNQTLAPGAILLAPQSQLGFGAAKDDKLYFYSANQDELLDTRDVTNSDRGLAAGHGSQWLYPNVPTPGTANTFAFQNNIVINEIMYHAAGGSDEEWIELYNRGTTTIDISSWTFQNAIDYTFPSGTQMAAGSYLVISNNAAALRLKYPGATIIGDFSKSLSNTDDDILLVAADKNPADEVHYYDGGDWPSLPDAGGSSLELRSPFADNSKPEAWAASNERDAAPWQTYTYTMTAAPDTGPTGLWNEFLFGMLDSGEVLIDNVSVVANPTGAATQLIQNGSFESDALGSSPAHWRIIGNHFGTVITDPDNPTNKVLDLVATGVTDQIGNNAGTTLAGNTAVVNGTAYKVTFNAKWIGGSNQLNSRLYLSRVDQTELLTMPTVAGTPGAQNSTYEANVGPTYNGLTQGPIMPAANQAVTVSVNAADPDGIASMTLFWRTDGGSWQTVAMSLGATGAYAGTIPGQTAGKVVQFYVQGQDTLGAFSTYPAAGVNSRALYQVNDGAGTTQPIDTIRIVMLSADTAPFLDDTEAMSNAYVGGTVVYNNSQIFYDVGIRPKGSARSRLDTNYWGSYDIEFHPDQLFRGVQDTITIDSSGSGGQVNYAPDEMLVKQVINHSSGGLPSSYDDLAYAISPISAQSGPAILQLAGYGNQFLDESYDNGSDGTEFEYEIIYYPQQTTDGNPESPKLITPNGVIGTPLTNLGTSADNYRWNFLIKNNRADDDYSRIITMAQTFGLNDSAFLAQIGSIIDVPEWLRVFAVANLAGVGDSYASGGNAHNVRFYVRPDDNRVVLMPWDWDVAFTGSTSASLVKPPDLTRLLQSPAYWHDYYGDLLDMVNNSYNSTYMAPWVNTYGTLVGINFGPDLTFIQNRATSVLSQLSSIAPQVSFAITTNGGNPFSVNALSTTLAGTGWINVSEIKVAGNDQALPLTWTANSTWQITVPLSYGANNLTLNAYDQEGNLVGTAAITVTSTLADPRQADALRITELMYHPASPPPGGNYDKEEFEYIEIENISNASVSLQGAQLLDAVTFTFPAMTLAPGEFTVVVEDTAAFLTRYTQSITIAGQYSGKLNNAGELVTFKDVNGNTIQSFTYSDVWYPSTDGGGYSLVIVDPLGALSNWGVKSGWRASTNLQGSPGAADPSPLPADVNQDGVVNGLDIALVASHWLQAGPTGDANSDGVVNGLDIALIASNWLATTGSGAGSGASNTDVALSTATAAATQSAAASSAPSSTSAALTVPTAGATTTALVMLQPAAPLVVTSTTPETTFTAAAVPAQRVTTSDDDAISTVTAAGTTVSSVLPVTPVIDDSPIVPNTSIVSQPATVVGWPSSNPSFTAPQTVDRVAASLGGLPATPVPAAVDRLLRDAHDDDSGSLGRIASAQAHRLTKVATGWGDEQDNTAPEVAAIETLPSQTIDNHLIDLLARHRRSA